MIPKFALGIDWETTGYSTPNYAAFHQGISFGAIIFDVQTLEPVEDLYRELKFNPSYKWDAGAERIHGLSQSHLAANGVDQEQAAADLANLVVKYVGTGDLMLLGHRVHFDRAFTEQLMQTIGIGFTYHPTVIDTCSIASVLMELDRSDDIFTTLGLPARKKHNALEDIYYTLASVQRMKDFFLRGVAASL